MLTGTMARGANGPLEEVVRGVASVMMEFAWIWADLKSSEMAVCSIFELRRRDALYDNQRNETGSMETNFRPPGSIG